MTEPTEFPSEISLLEQDYIRLVTLVTPDLLYIFDLVEQRNVYSNRNVLSILGYSPEEIRQMGNQAMSHLLHPEDRLRLQHIEQIRPHLTPGEYVESEYRMRHKNGHWVWLNSRELNIAFNPDGTVSRIFGIARDITIEKEREQERELLMQQAVALADLDPLTSLYNHRTFHQRLRYLGTPTLPPPAAVLFFDMDNFKFFNKCTGI